MKKLEETAGKIREKCSLCYLDTGAMSLLPEEVSESILDFHKRRQIYGPAFSEYWEEAEKLRGLIGDKIGCDASEIMFLWNTSMGINLAARALSIGAGDNVVISNIEFPSNVYPWMNLEREGVEVRMLDLSQGTLTEESLDALCDERTKVISLSWVQATTGMVADLKAISRYARQRQIYFLVDAIQGLGALPLDLREVEADFLVSGFYKWLLGPDGLSFVYINKKILPNLKIPFTGWAGMENKFDYSAYHFQLSPSARRYESGNLNFSGIYGAAKALELTRGQEGKICAKIQELTAYLRRELKERKEVEIITPDSPLRSGITLFTCPKADALYEMLKKRGIVVNYRTGIRVSTHFYNTVSDIQKLLEAIDDFYKEKG